MIDIKKIGFAGIAILTLWFVSSFHASAETTPRVSKDHIVVVTSHGNLLLALYPDIAPKHTAHMLDLTKSGLFNSTHFMRIHPDFVVQLSSAIDRLTPLRAEQETLARKTVDAEFSNLKHQKGTLSMARWEDPNSATSSFSVLLGDAPHLDGEYTIFGHLVSGGSVINKMLMEKTNVDSKQPINRISVVRAVVININDLQTYYRTNPYDPPSLIGNAQNLSTGVTLDDDGSTQEAYLEMIAFMILAMIVVGLLGFYFYDKISKKIMLSLLLINVLIGSFILMIIALPIGHQHSWIAAVLYLGMFAMFRIMSQFESKQ